MNKKDAKQIAYYLAREMDANNINAVNTGKNEENLQGLDADPPNVPEKRQLAGFFRITLSHAGWWLVHNYKKLFLAFFLIIIIWSLYDLFGLWLLVFFVITSIVITAVLFFVRQKDRVYIIEVNSNPESKDNFKVWSMSQHRFNQYDKQGNVNPIDTSDGIAYIVEELDRNEKKMRMSYRHTTLDFWARKDAFLDLREKAIKLGDTLDKTTLLKDYDVHTQSRKKVHRALTVVNEALFPDKKNLTQTTNFNKFMGEVQADVKKYKEEKKLD